MIPYYVSRSGIFRAALAGVTAEKLDLADYPGKKSVRVDASSKAGSLFKNPILRGITYLLKNSASIDVLHLYHFKLSTAVLCKIYRFKNPGGKIYIKLDADRNILRYYSALNRSLPETLVRYPLRAWVRKAVTRLADLISVETEEIRELLADQDKKNLEGKLFLNPYGIPVEEFEKYYPARQVKRKNQIITVGRIGTYQKNTEMLLNALSLMKNRKKWKIKIAGPIEPGFRDKIEAFYRVNPHCGQTVQFTGNISKRRDLYKLFLESKLFVLTSRFESWGIVLTEAGYFGDTIVSTDTGCARAVTGNGKFGAIVPQEDPVTLARVLDDLTEKDRSAAVSKRVHLYCEKNFDWATVADNLTKRVLQCLKNKKR